METLQMLETLNAFIEEERAGRKTELCRIFYKKEGDEE